MPNLYKKLSGELIGTITAAELKLLVDQLEEEDLTDDDYFIDQPTVDLIEANGASPTLVALLRTAVGDTGGIDVRWEK